MPTDAEDVMDCLRCGIPPEGGLAEMIVGHDPLREQVQRTLSRIAAGKTPSAVRFFVGPPGAGKSTLLKLVELEAYEAKFAVCNINVDAKSGVFTEPRYLVAEVFRTLRVPGIPPPGDWNELLRKFASGVIETAGRGGLPAMGSERVAGIRSAIDHRFSGLHLEEPSVKTAVLAYAVSLDHDNEAGAQRMRNIVKWFSGDHLATSGLRDGWIDARLDDRTAFPILRSGLTVLRAAGVPGLALLVDEMRHAAEQWAGSQRERSYSLLQGFIDRDVPSTFVAVAATPDLFSDRWKGIASSAALYSRTGGSPDDSTEGRNPIALRYEIGLLSVAEQKSLFKHLLMLHPGGKRWRGSGHTEEISTIVENFGFGDGVLARDFVRLSVAYLDSRIRAAR